VSQIERKENARDKERRELITVDQNWVAEYNKMRVMVIEEEEKKVQWYTSRV
jgi:hypothetical protein